MKTCLISNIAVIPFLSLLSVFTTAAVAADISVDLEVSTDGSTWVGISPSTQSLSSTQAYVRTAVGPLGGPASPGEALHHDFPTGAGELEVNLQSSTDLATWSDDSPGTVSLSDKKFYRVTTNAFSFIPAGSFTMGSPVSELGREPIVANETQHSVTLTNGFYMQQTEVTWAQWIEVRDWALGNGYSGLSFGENGVGGDASGNHPVTRVGWFVVLKWLNARSEREGLTPCYTIGGIPFRTGTGTIPVCDFNANGYRLPTEAEWEYACRAGTTTATYNGDLTETALGSLDPNLDPIAWYEGNAGGTTHPVGGKQPNAWGLYDMLGSVYEWCWDWYDGDYGSGSVVDPTGPVSSATQTRIYRGGAWSVISPAVRSAFRGSNIPVQENGFNTVGFRPVRTAGN